MSKNLVNCNWEELDDMEGFQKMEKTSMKVARQDPKRTRTSHIAASKKAAKRSQSRVVETEELAEAILGKGKKSGRPYRR